MLEKTDFIVFVLEYFTDRKDWLELRAEYLSLQKKSMTNLKKTINKLHLPEDKPSLERKKKIEPTDITDSSSGTFNLSRPIAASV